MARTKYTLPTSSTAWKPASRDAMEGFIRDLERDLPPEATLAEIERAVFEHHRALLSEVVQALAARRAASPPHDD